MGDPLSSLDLAFEPVDLGPDPWIGREIGGRYAIEKLIGEGTAGVVYRARHLAMDKPVAVKLLHGVALGSRRAEMEERFRLEARVYGQIAHPHVCAATDFGVTDDGVRFLVMELLEGRTLHDAIHDEAPMAPERAVAIAVQIAEGLQAVHGVGVVHRDLKPENVFLVSAQGQDDWVKLVDFGIARNITDDKDQGRLTGAGMIYGTPAYLAPEQTRTMDVDGRADLYALGVVLFEMLVGRLPFERDSALGFMQAHAVEVPPRVRELAPNVPAGLGRLVDRLLDKVPEQRPPDAATLRGLLALSLDAVEPIDEVEIMPRERGVAPSLTSPGEAPDSSLSTLEQVAQKSVSVPIWLVAVGVVAVAVIALVAGRMSSSDAKPGNTTAASADVPAAADSGVGETSSVNDRPAATKQDVEKKPVAVAAPAKKSGMPFPVKVNTLTPAEMLAKERRAFEARREVAQALAQRKSNPQLTLNELRRVLAAEPKNAHAHYLLGLTQHDMGSHLEASQSWLTALTLDGRYGADQEMAQRLLDDFAMAGGPAQQAAEKAIVKGRVLVASTRPLSHIIRQGMNADLIGRLHGLAQRTRVLQDMPELDQQLLILRAVTACEVRSKALVKLSELSDVAALPILRRLQSSHRGCGSNGNDDCIACIRPLLERVIGQLEKSAK